MKRYYYVIACFFVVCFFMTSCMMTQDVAVSDQEITDIWKGRTKKEIIYNFGPPTRETSDGADGTILVYEYNLGSNTATKTTYSEYNKTVREQSNTNYVNEYAWFFMDSEDVCVGVRQNHFKKQERIKDSRSTVALVATSLCCVVLPLFLYLVWSSYDI